MVNIGNFEVFVQKSLVLILFFIPFLSLSKEVIHIASAKLYIKSFQKLISETPCNKVQGTNKSLARGVADLLIICQAFEESSLDVEFKFTPVPNYARGYSLVKEGKVHLNAETIWENQHDEELFYLTEPIIPKGEFEVGVYVPAHRTDLLAIKSLKELQKYSAVSQKTWVNDWTLLERLNLKKIHDVSTIPQMFKMVAHGRIDFLLWTFTSNDKLSQKIQDVELHPIPGVKFTIPNSRHYAVSKASPNSYKIFHALNAGILKLRAKGLIKDAYQKSGFINPKVKTGKILHLKINS